MQLCVAKHVLPVNVFSGSIRYEETGISSDDHNRATLPMLILT